MDFQQQANLHPPEEQTVRKRKESDLKIVVRKVKGRARAKIEPVSLVPRTIEEAPLRRMDRRALNALRKRRADKHMIAFLLILGFIGLALGVASIVLYSRWIENFSTAVEVVQFSGQTLSLLDY